jgi:hypothetical protein
LNKIKTPQIHKVDIRSSTYWSQIFESGTLCIIVPETPVFADTTTGVSGLSGLHYLTSRYSVQSQTNFVDF